MAPIENAHLVTKGYYDDGKSVAQWNADKAQGISFPTPTSEDDKLYLQYDHSNDQYTLVSGVGASVGSSSITLEYLSPIWAEENAGLSTNTFEWAFGNGANTPSDRGVVVHVPSGWSCAAIAMGLSLNGGTATVELNLNGVNQGSTANVSVSSGNSNINTFSAVSISDGDVINFRTQSASSTAGPCQVVVWLRFYKEITVSGGSGASDFLDLIDTPTTYSGSVGNYVRVTTSGLEFAPISTGVTDHGDLIGLNDDDHPQYHNDVRGDIRYYTQDQINTISGSLQSEISTKSDDGHTHIESDITDLNKYTRSEVDYLITSVSGAIVTDHGELEGLLDDDHPHYLLSNGTRSLSEDWNYGTSSISGTGSFYGNGATLSGVSYVYDDDVYFYDTTRDKDLGVAVIQIGCGRSSSNTTDQYLRLYDGTPMNSTGSSLPFDATLVGISLMGQRNDQTWTAQVRKNDVVTIEDSLTITNSYENHTWSKDKDFSAGDRIQVYMLGRNINYPQVELYFRRRK